MSLIESIWVEKYRPLKIDDVVFSENHEEDFRRYVEIREIPHLLLHGPPGGGKCHGGDEYIEIYVEDD